MELSWASTLRVYFALGEIGDFLHSCGKSEFSDGEPPHVMVGVGSEGLPVPE